METIILIATGLGGLLLLDFSSLRWGISSVETLDSPEWEKRRNWRGFGGRR